MKLTLTEHLVILASGWNSPLEETRFKESLSIVEKYNNFLKLRQSFENKEAMMEEIMSLHEEFKNTLKDYHDDRKPKNNS